MIGNLKSKLVGDIEVVDDKPEAVLELLEEMYTHNSNLNIAFMNSNLYVSAYKKALLNQICDDFLFLNDGLAIKLTQFLKFRTIQWNLNGTDFIPKVLNYKTTLKVALIGGGDTVNEKMVSYIRETYNHKVVFTMDGYKIWDDLDGSLKTAAESKPDLLLFAMGNPIQEELIIKYRSVGGGGVAFGVGAFFDFMTGNSKRAPAIYRSLSLEWLYRLIREPRRLIRRYSYDIVYFLILSTLAKRGDHLD